MVVAVFCQRLTAPVACARAPSRSLVALLVIRAFFCAAQGHNDATSATPLPRALATACAGEDWGSSALAQCEFWGAFHFWKNFGPQPFTYDGLGVYQLATASNGFKIQSFQCAFNAKKPAVSIGVAMMIDGRKVVLFDNAGKVDGQEVTTTAPAGLFYAGNLQKNARGVEVISSDGCVRVNVDRCVFQNATPGWLHNVKIRVGSNIKQDSGLCASRDNSSAQAQFVAYNSPDMLFDFLDLVQLCGNCRGQQADDVYRKPPTCAQVEARRLHATFGGLGIATARNLATARRAASPAVQGVWRSSASVAGTCSAENLSVALSACSQATGSFNHDSCMEDWCVSGRAALADNALLETTRDPSYAANCSNQRGMMLNAFYPCVCGGDVIANNNELCKVDASGHGITSRAPDRCTVQDGYAFSASYPCTCGNSICGLGTTQQLCSQDGAGDGLCSDIGPCSMQAPSYPCVCSGGVAIGQHPVICALNQECQSGQCRNISGTAQVCTARNGASASAVYPCSCGDQVCLQYQRCDSDHAGGCLTPRNCDVNNGTATSSSYPCRCGMSACQQGQVCNSANGQGCMSEADALSAMQRIAAPTCSVTTGVGPSSSYPCKCGAANCLQGQWCNSVFNRGCLSEASAKAELERAAIAGVLQRAESEGIHFNMSADNLDCAAILADPMALEHLRESAIQGVMKDLGVPRQAVGVRIFCGSIIIKTYVLPVPGTAKMVRNSLRQARAFMFPGVTRALRDNRVLSSHATGVITINWHETGNQMPLGSESLGTSSAKTSAMWRSPITFARCSPSVCLGKALLQVSPSYSCIGSLCTQAECCESALTGSRADVLHVVDAEALGDVRSLWNSAPQFVQGVTVPKAGLSLCAASIAGLMLFSRRLSRQHWRVGFSRALVEYEEQDAVAKEHQSRE